MAIDLPSPPSLRAQWTTLYTLTLPSLARAKHPTQPHWPVHLDHCFARIILDTVVGIDTPWTSKLNSPAVKNMDALQLRKCVALGEAIAGGKVDLVALDERSLVVRGKKGKRKRKRGEGGEEASKDELREESSRSKRVQVDIRAAMTGNPNPNHTTTMAEPKPALFPKSSTNPPPPNTPNPALTSLITTSTLTPFRKRVLLALLQVPHGQYTTYAALSDHLHSCARAVGNAMRNNPFAPEVPCHRVVAADGGLGGFGGEWGVGCKRDEKVKLLRSEGVRVDESKGRVVGGVWRGFV